MSAPRSRGRFVASLALVTALLGPRTAGAQPYPTKASDPVPLPERTAASGDDTTAIAVNPANLAFLPGPELRWNWAWMDDASPLPARGHAAAFGLPIWIFATGLRMDWIDPPATARSFYPDSYRWLRWDIAVRGGDTVALGTTLAWSYSDDPRLDGAVSATTGLTLRPSTYLSLAAVARDWNAPRTANRTTIERSYDFGAALRPVYGRRDVEIGVQGSYVEGKKAWVPRATLGVDVPRVGRLRGDVTMLDPVAGDFVALAGLDVNLGLLQVGGGGLFGSAPTRSGAGFFATAALRGFREPGVVLPTKVARIRIDSTPGVRGHTRLLRRLWRLADDRETAGVLLVLRAEPAGSIAHAEEIGDAVRMLRARGKKVLCDLEDAGGRSLYVCSQADRTIMLPGGGMRFAGLSSSYYYLGDLAKKLGVRTEFVRIGEHKTAAEQLTLSHGTDVARADHQEYLDQVANTFYSDIGGGRRIPLSVLKARLAKGPFIAPEARDAGFVDTLAYDDEVGRVVDDVMGGRVRIVDDDPMERAPERWGDPPKIAMIYLDGDMVDGESRSIPFIGIKLAGSYTVARALRKAREDGSVRAVVFRLETGGGSTLASEVILREVALTAKVKPVVVSMGGAAASGGYYVAVGGHPIFANRTTLTGSIGIFYGKADVAQLLDKIGIHFDLLRTTPRADAESIYRPFTDDERVALGAKVKQFYDLFVGRVAEGRHMSGDAVDAIARGKVWTGEQAKARGLVDELGGLRQALEKARAMGGLPSDCPIEELPPPNESLLGMVLDLAGVRAVLGTTPAAGMASLVPPALLDIARALTPFLVYDGTRPLARTELVGDVSVGGSGPVGVSVEEP
jgi:protease-4